MKKQKRKLKKNFKRILILIVLIIISFMVFKNLPSKVNFIEKFQAVDIKLSHDNIYLVVGEELKVTSNYPELDWVSDNPELASVKDGVITGIAPGKLTIKASKAKKSSTINVFVTDIITVPTLNNKKPYLKCKQYTKEENDLLDKLLKMRIDEAGYQTRAGAVAAARFLTLEFKHRIHYFYENGRLLTNNERPYVDGEGRYYHTGLYLNEEKYKDLKKSMHGPATWGCNLYSRITKATSPNGIDCSGYVSWILLNAGFDVGDAGAGISSTKTNDLDDLGPKLKINKTNLDEGNFKVGDLFSTYGHIGILIGLDDTHIYVAESLDYDLHVNTYTKESLLASNWKYIIQLDELYKEDGNLTNMW